MRVLPWVRSLFVIALSIGPPLGCGQLRSGPNAPIPESDAGLDADATAPSPFEVVQALPGGAAFSSVFAFDDENVFVVGTGGVHLDYQRGKWTRRAVTPGRDYYQVWGLSEDELYTVGTINATNEGVVQKWTGLAWQDEYIAGTPIVAIWGDSQLVLAVGPDGRVFGKQVGTTEWAQRTRFTSPTVPDFMAVTGNGPKDVTFVADQRIYHTTNFGDFTWVQPDRHKELRFLCAWPGRASGTNVFIGGNFLSLLWLHAPNALSADLLDPSSVLNEPDASIADLRMARLVYDERSIGAKQQYIRGVAGNNSKVYAVGDASRIYALDLATVDVRPIPSPVEASFGGVAVTSTSVWVVGERELVLRAPLF